jgi:hypothetical protein
LRILTIGEGPTPRVFRQRDVEEVYRLPEPRDEVARTEPNTELVRLFREWKEADLLLRLVELQLTEPYQKAIRWWATTFSKAPSMTVDEYEKRFPEGSQGDVRFNIVARFWEAAGAIVKHRLVGEDLFFDRFRGVGSEWRRVKTILLGARRKYDPGLALNFEYLAAREAAWRKRHRLERKR